MEKLRFETSGGTADPDERVLSDDELEQAEGEASDPAAA
jgi:hypothetical protein